MKISSWLLCLSIVLFSTNNITYSAGKCACCLICCAPCGAVAACTGACCIASGICLKEMCKGCCDAASGCTRSLSSCADGVSYQCDRCYYRMAQGVRNVTECCTDSIRALCSPCYNGAAWCSDRCASSNPSPSYPVFAAYATAAPASYPAPNGGHHGVLAAAPENPNSARYGYADYAAAITPSIDAKLASQSASASGGHHEVLAAAPGNPNPAEQAACAAAAGVVNTPMSAHNHEIYTAAPGGPVAAACDAPAQVEGGSGVSNYGTFGVPAAAAACVSVHVQVHSSSSMPTCEGLDPDEEFIQQVAHGQRRIDDKNGHEQTALLCALGRMHNHPQAYATLFAHVQSLLKMRADIHVQDNAHCTPLMAAARGGYHVVTKLLIDENTKSSQAKFSQQALQNALASILNKLDEQPEKVSADQASYKDYAKTACCLVTARADVTSPLLDGEHGMVSILEVLREQASKNPDSTLATVHEALAAQSASR